MSYRGFQDDDSNGPTSHPTMESTRMYMDQLRSDDPNERLQGTTMLRRLWCENQQPLDPEVASEVVPRLATILLNEIDFPKLQYEAAWALGSAVVPETSFIQTEAASALIQSLWRVSDSSCRDLRALAVAEMAAWAIGTLAAASLSVRHHFFSLGVFDAFIGLLRDGPDSDSVTGAREGLGEKVIWAVSRMCGPKQPHPPPIQLLLTAVPTLLQYLTNPQRLPLMINASVAIFLISNLGASAAQVLVSLGVLPVLVRLLPCPDVEVQLQMIQTLGNFVSYDDLTTSSVLAAGALPHFRFLLCHTDARIRREVCWTLSNICAGTQDQRQAVIDEGLIEPLLMSVADPEYKVREEALWAIANVASASDKEQLASLVSVGILDVVCGCCLDPSEPQAFLGCALECIETVLASEGDDPNQEDEVESNYVNPYAEALNLNGGRLKIEALKDHGSARVLLPAESILGKFFACSTSAFDFEEELREQQS